MSVWKTSMDVAGETSVRSLITQSKNYIILCDSDMQIDRQTWKYARKTNTKMINGIRFSDELQNPWDIFISFHFISCFQHKKNQESHIDKINS